MLSRGGGAGGIPDGKAAWVALYIDDQSFVGGWRSPYPECNADHSIVFVCVLIVFGCVLLAYWCVLDVFG